MKFDRKILYIILSNAIAIILFNKLADILSEGLGSIKGTVWAFLITGIIISLCSLLFCLYEYNTRQAKSNH